jgi:competence protein ComEC
MLNGTSDRPVLADSFWRAPLVRAAVAFTAGIVYDRFFSPALFASLTLAFVCLLAWLIVFLTHRRPGLAVCYLVLAFAPLGAAYHHYRHNIGPTNTLGDLTDAKPVAVQLRGFLDEEPSAVLHGEKQTLPARSQVETWRTVLQATSWKQDGEWHPCTDRVRVSVEGDVLDLHEGDEVEIRGKLSAIAGPKNPGERDFQLFNRDQGIYTRILVRGEPVGVVRLDQRWPESYRGWLSMVRGWGQRTLEAALPNKLISGLAAALVLGDNGALPADDWERYKNTGVIHVLVVSGQHLVLLAAILLWILPRLGCRQTPTAWIVGTFMILYILLTGARPPGVRSAVAMSAWYGSWILRRRMVPTNILALAWLIVAAINPMDLFTPGCQLSFLSVLILYRIGLLWDQQERDALDKQDPRGVNPLLERLQPFWVRWLRGQWAVIWESYKVSFLVWLGITPLVAYHYHIVPTVAMLLGPPVSLLTSIALLAGFVLLALAAAHLVGIGLCALLLGLALRACDILVVWTDRWWWGHTYIPELPAWWFIGCYAGILPFLTLRSLHYYWRPAVLVGLGWLCIGLLLPLVRIPTGELRCTFLAVGHGGCTVLETSAGRVLLYDAGAMSGPDVADQHIIPFLRHRGIRGIDEVLISHGDWDHFNGLIQLLDRFPVGQVTCTPTFVQTKKQGVAFTLKILRQRGIPLRIVQAGDRLSAGDGVEMEVLHPPAAGPEGEENFRSLTLRIVHEGNVFLLTGDLKGPGLERVLGLLKGRVDVLMAPHHGSRRLDAEGLVERAKPWLIVASMGNPLGKGGYPEAYLRKELVFWTTNECGAITLRSHSTGLVAENFLNRERVAQPRKADVRKR